jgi:hypothetical protein
MSCRPSKSTTAVEPERRENKGWGIRAAEVRWRVGPALEAWRKHVRLHRFDRLRPEAVAGPGELVERAQRVRGPDEGLAQPMTDLDRHAGAARVIDGSLPRKSMASATSWTASSEQAASSLSLMPRTYGAIRPRPACRAQFA